jgi:hypothetical protein
VTHFSGAAVSVSPEILIVRLCHVAAQSLLFGSRKRMTADAAANNGLAKRISEIEEAYEFMLSYAAQGHQRGMEGDLIRSYLKQVDAALAGISEAATAAAVATGADPAIFRPFMATLDEDAGKARAGLRLALSQRAIGSQLIDNLNASIHLRALLTDLFLIDEAIDSMGA